MNDQAQGSMNGHPYGIGNGVADMKGFDMKRADSDEVAIGNNIEIYVF